MQFHVPSSGVALAPLTVESVPPTPTVFLIYTDTRARPRTSSPDG